MHADGAFSTWKKRKKGVNTTIQILIFDCLQLQYIEVQYFFAKKEKRSQW